MANANPRRLRIPLFWVFLALKILRPGIPKKVVFSASGGVLPYVLDLTIQPSTFQMMMHSMSFVNTQSMVQILSTILLMLQEYSIHTEITELSIQVMIFILRNNSRKIQKLYLVLYFYSTVYFCSNIAIYNGIHPKRKKQFNHYH